MTHESEVESAVSRQPNYKSKMSMIAADTQTLYQQDFD